MVYIGSDREPPLIERDEISVKTLSPEDSQLLSWIDRSFVRFIGAHTGCSCGFRHIVAQQPVPYFDGMFPEEDEDPKDRESTAALIVLLKSLLAPGESLTVYPVWFDSKAEPPLGTIHLRADELSAETFFFVEQFLYEIAAV
jgi:hypothetical protein